MNREIRNNRIAPKTDAELIDAVLDGEIATTATEITGIVPTPPENASALESYQSISGVAISGEQK